MNSDLDKWHMRNRLKDMQGPLKATQLGELEIELGNELHNAI